MADNHMQIAEHRPETTVEREAKLLAPATFRLPDLDGLVPGAVAEALPERRLDATYYDTPDLRLVRSGITLRHRRDGSGPAEWTVKLPVDARGPVLARREIRVTGPPDRVPDEAVDLVLAATRARRLRPVARLATVRLPVRICDRLGHRLAEIVDDTVTASADEQPTRRFREVEVEVSADAPARLLAAAVSRLAEADCTARSATPKLVRALGEPARRPPDVVVEPLPADPSVEDLIRHALAAGVAQILRHDPGVRLGDDPEDVHQLRVATRRLRSDLRTFAPLLDRSPVAGIRAELGWLATVVGAVRDIDVLTARLRAAGRTLPDLDAPAVTALLCRVDGEAGTARAAMLEALRSPRYLHLLDALVALAAAPPPAPDVDPAGRPPAELAADLVRRPWRRLAEAVAALPPQPPDEALHRIRILAKRCRYATEAVSPVIGKRAARFADRLAELQTVLGDHHDTTVAESWLRTAARDEPATAVAAGELLAGERRRRAELRRRWPLAWKTASRGRLRRGR